MNGAGFVENKAVTEFNLRAALETRAESVRASGDLLSTEPLGFANILQAAFFDTSRRDADNLSFLAKCIDPSREISGAQFKHLLELFSVFTSDRNFMRAATHIGFHLRDGDYAVSATTIRQDMRGHIA
jgi:hypothetical protein